MTALRLAGRCANGSERDRGSLFHSVPQGKDVALCGAEPGRRSAGWCSDPGDAVTCPRCLSAIRKAIRDRNLEEICAMHPK